LNYSKSIFAWEEIDANTFIDDFKEYFVQWRSDYVEQDFLALDDCQSFKFLIGRSDWALDANQDAYYAYLDSIREFLQNNPWAQDIDWMIDYEPYTNQEWDDPAQQLILIRNFLENLRDFKALVAEFGNSLNIVIPAWYERREYLGSDLLREVALIADEVLIMSYRDTFDGANSILDIVSDDIQILAELDTSFYLALETIDIEPSNTFFEEGRVALFDMIERLDNHFVDNELYQGTAIHYLDSYRLLH